MKATERTKICLTCKKTFYSRYGEGISKWIKRKFCNYSCATKTTAKGQRRNPANEFKKGVRQHWVEKTQVTTLFTITFREFGKSLEFVNFVVQLQSLTRTERWELIGLTNQETTKEKIDKIGWSYADLVTNYLI